MTKTKTAKYRNERLEVLHKTAAGLARLGALTKTAMREAGAFCLTKVEPSTAEQTNGGKVGEYQVKRAPRHRPPPST
jgi:hypothetical protein